MNAKEFEYTLRKFWRLVRDITSHTDAQHLEDFNAIWLALEAHRLEMVAAEAEFDNRKGASTFVDVGDLAERIKTIEQGLDYLTTRAARHLKLFHCNPEE